MKNANDQNFFKFVGLNKGLYGNIKYLCTNYIMKTQWDVGYN